MLHDPLPPDGWVVVSVSSVVVVGFPVDAVVVVIGGPFVVVEVVGAVVDVGDSDTVVGFSFEQASLPLRRILVILG